MTAKSTGISTRKHTGVTIAFREKYTGSAQFMNLFREGMALVEMTASYLDGQGRVDSRGLKQSGALAYASESMRLTTRLMQLASWLLLRRAVRNGEMTEAQANDERHKLPLCPLTRSTRAAGYDELPEKLIELVDASLRLHERILRLDRMIHEETLYADAAHPYPLSAHMDRIREAFSAG
jgi:regulator of CtrA degradation